MKYITPRRNTGLGLLFTTRLTMPTTRSQNRKRAADGEDGPPAKRARKRSQSEAPGDLSEPAGPSQKTPRPPSEHWWPFNPDRAPKPIIRVISTANWPFLCDLAVKHHPSKSDSLSCTANLERLARGYFNVAIELSFSDGTFWIARIRIPPQEPEEEVAVVEEREDQVKKDEKKEKVVERAELAGECEEDDDEEGDGDDDDADNEELENKIEMLSEIATMRLVAQRTSIPVPEVYCYDWTQNNPFGFSYMLMTALPGKSLKDCLGCSVPKELQPKLAAQMAGYILQLSKITFYQIGQIWAGDGLDEDPRILPFMLYGQDVGPFNSSTACFRGMQQAKNEAILSWHGEDSDWPQWHQFSEIQTGVIPFLTNRELRRGPFPLWHRDFHFKNMLVDDEYNITGVLDWTGARVAPWEDFIVYGDMLPFLGMSAEQNQPLLDFRATLIEAFSKVEGGREQKGRRQTPLLSDMMSSGIVDVISASWAHPRKAEHASRDALHLLRLLFGEETTLVNWKVRQRKLSRRFPWQ